MDLGNRSKESKIQSSHSKLQISNTSFPTYPINVPYPDLKREKQLSYMLKGRHDVAHFAYKDADGKTLGYVVRLEDKDGNKITPTLTYCQNEKGQKSWQFKGFGDDRPLYGLDVLKQKPDAPVLIVEGEKTCDYARDIFKDHAVITWNGGCGSVQKTDWSPLKGRDVTLWPDHDKAGYRAANKIATILNDQGAKIVSIIDLPSTLAHKWDLADPLPNGFTYEGLREHKVKCDYHKQAEFKCMEHEEIQKIAEALGTSLNKNYRDFELSLMNILYKSYKEMDPQIQDLDLKIKAVSVGIYLHTYLSYLGFKGQFKEENFNKAYKISLKAYFSIEKVGNFNKAFDHAHDVFQKEKNSDHPLNTDLHLSLSSHHDYPLQGHIQNVFSHIKAHEKMLTQMHLQHQHTIDLQKQQEIQQHHQRSRGFEREL